MSKLRLSDVFRIFQYYEPSKVKLFELIRNTDPIYMSALVYLIKNISKKNETSVWIPDDLSFDYEINNNTDVLYTIETSIKFSLDQNEIIRQILPILTNEQLNEHCENIDLLQFIDELRDGQKRKSLWFNLISNNLTSSSYHCFVNNLNDLLYPEYKQQNRNETSTTTSVRSEIKKLLDYYDTITYKNIITDNMEPKSFRSLIRKPAKRIYELPINMMQNYIIQPLYNGFRVVIHSDGITTRCFNIHGELLHGFLYHNHIKSHATFEAIVLPITRNKKFRSWRYWQYKHNIAIIVVDVFRIKHQMFTYLPFSQRVKQIPTIFGDNIYNINIPLNELKEYELKRDLYSPIRGIILRQINQDCSNETLEYRFNLNVYYNFINDNIEMLKLNQSLDRIHYTNYINFDMAKYRTICAVYSDDTKYYYICKFKANIFQFIHVGRIEKLPYDQQIVKYKSDRIYVVNNKCDIKGIAYLRVYYNNSSEFKIIGYDFKKTDSFYNLPSQNTTNDLFNNFYA